MKPETRTNAEIMCMKADERLANGSERPFSGVQDNPYIPSNTTLRVPLIKQCVFPNPSRLMCTAPSSKRLLFVRRVPSLFSTC